MTVKLITDNDRVQDSVADGQPDTSEPLQTKIVSSQEAEISPSNTILSGPDHVEKNRNSLQSLKQAWWPWWWWEIAGSFVSIIFLACLFGFLLAVNGKRRYSWKLRIDPNTLLAMLSTVIKTAMMVPVVSCISQLKWQHFASCACPLHMLDVIDRCSRGPWGAMVLLLKIPKSRVILPGLAIVTIGALGLEPSIQQILDIGERVVPSHNATARVATAREYKSKAYSEDFYPTDHLYRLHSSLASGLYDASRPWPYCDGDLCEWDVFTTLAVCLDFKDLSKESKHHCRRVTDSDMRQEQSYLECTYTVPKNPDWKSDQMSSRPGPFTWKFVNAVPGHGSNNSNSTKMSWGKNNLLMNARAETRKDDESPHTVFDIFAISDDWLSGDDSSESPVVHVYQARFYLCAQTISNLSVDYTPRGNDAKEPDVSTERLFHRQTARNTSSIANGTGFYKLETRPRGRTYFMYDSATWIFDLLNAWFNEVIAESTSSGQVFGKQSFLGIYIYTTGIEQSMRNIATTLSTQLQSNAEGDNMFSTPVAGRARVLELHFHVRWAWAVIIFVEVISVAALLAATIRMTSGMPLLKDSVFAFLVHGLEGWGSVRPPQPENIRSLDRMGAEMTAQFTEGSDGVTKFVKQA